MILFVIAVTAYVGALILVKPAPKSLKASPLSYRENLTCVWGAICSGVVILVVFFLTTDYGFITVDENLYRILALSRDIDLFLMFPFQAVTHLFVHVNLLHLAGNVVGLGVASAYERRVGAKRYFAVLTVGSLASIPSIFFYSGNVIVCGISGGVFGLAAAYFTDEEKLTTKEWGTAILLFLFLALMLGLNGELEDPSRDLLNMQVDHIGHFLGALGAILYCRLTRLYNKHQR
jgi:membrane associated rhomboid family serine protease